MTLICWFWPEGGNCLPPLPGVIWGLVRKIPRFLLGLVCLALPLTVAGSPARATDTNALSWRVKQNQVDAAIQKWPLSRLLNKIVSATGWMVIVEPGLTNEVSAKFKNLPQDEALRRLLGNLNYFRDETNGVSRLKVWQTVSTAATQRVQAEKKDYRIPNELLVKLKRNPTNSMDNWPKNSARRLSAATISSASIACNSPMAARRMPPCNPWPPTRRSLPWIPITRWTPGARPTDAGRPGSGWSAVQSESAGGQRPDCWLG